MSRAHPWKRIKGWYLTSKILRSGFMLGTVVAKKQPKTVRVAVYRVLKHKKYGTTNTRRTVLMVHDELNEANMGDYVILQQCKPYSKMKRWKIYDIATEYSPSRYLTENPEVAEKIELYNKEDVEIETLTKFNLNKKERKF